MNESTDKQEEPEGEKSETTPEESTSESPSPQESDSSASDAEKSAEDETTQVMPEEQVASPQEQTASRPVEEPTVAVVPDESAAGGSRWNPGKKGVWIAAGAAVVVVVFLGGLAIGHWSGDDDDHDWDQASYEREWDGHGGPGGPGLEHHHGGPGFEGGSEFEGGPGYEDDYHEGVMPGGKSEGDEYGEDEDDSSGESGSDHDFDEGSDYEDRPPTGGQGRGTQPPPMPESNRG